eukprot:559638_1
MPKNRRVFSEVETKRNKARVYSVAANLSSNPQIFFGSSAKPQQPTNVFGGSQQQSANLFNTNSQAAAANPFGNNQQQQSANPFGNSQQQSAANLFGGGQPQQPAANPFGASQPSGNVFGGNSQPAAGLFGNQPQQNTQQPSNAFGGGGGILNQPSGLGQASNPW